MPATLQRNEAPVGDWFEREPRAGKTILALVARLFHRGKATWPLWLLAALAVSAVATAMKLRGGSFESTVVLRVEEGQVSKPGAMLARGAVKAYVKTFAFSNPHLLELMSKHPTAFGLAATDPAFAVESFRDNLTIDIQEIDFVQVRDASDPPPSARLAISWKGSDPDLVWQITQELAALVVGATMARKQEELGGDISAANAEVSTAVELVRALEAERAAPTDPRLVHARSRLLSAQQRAQEAEISLRAAGQEQVLKFEIVDKGRVPPRPNRVQLGITTFLFTALFASLAAWLLAGAFDPRLLDEGDLTALKLPFLGRLPELPSSRAAPAPEPERPSLPSGPAVPRV